MNKDKLRHIEIVLTFCVVLVVLTSNVWLPDSQTVRILDVLDETEHRVLNTPPSVLLDKETRSYAFERFFTHLPEFERDVLVYAVFRKHVCPTLFSMLPVSDPEAACRESYGIPSVAHDGFVWREPVLADDIQDRVLLCRDKIADHLTRSVMRSGNVSGYYTELSSEVKDLLEKVVRDDTSKREVIVQAMRSFASGLDMLKEFRHDRTFLCNSLQDMERYQFDTEEFSIAHLQWESEMERLTMSGTDVEVQLIDDAYVAGMLAGCDVLDRHEFRVSIVSQLAYAARDFADQIKGE